MISIDVDDPMTVSIPLSSIRLEGADFEKFQKIRKEFCADEGIYDALRLIINEGIKSMIALIEFGDNAPREQTD